MHKMILVITLLLTSSGCAYLPKAEHKALWKGCFPTPVKMKSFSLSQDSSKAAHKFVSDHRTGEVLKAHQEYNNAQRCVKHFE